MLSADVRDLSETNVALATSGTLTVSDVDSPASFVAQAGTIGSYGTFAIDSRRRLDLHRELGAQRVRRRHHLHRHLLGRQRRRHLHSVTINILGTNDAAVLSPTSAT